MNQYPEKMTRNQKKSLLYKSKAVKKNFTTANLQNAEASSDS